MYGGDYMQEISMKPTARIYNFSELQKKKRQRELREKRPFFITGVVLIISLLCISFFFIFWRQCSGSTRTNDRHPV